MKDLNGYILRLDNALKEKLFFVDKINLYEYDLIIDFGCATGTLLNEISLIAKHAGVKLVGYDCSEDMLTRAKTLHPHLLFTSSFDQLIMWMLHACKPLVIFSSVLHEIPVSNDSAWKDIYEVMQHAHTVVVRDMKRPSNNEPISNITRKRVLSQVAPWQAEMFESKWGKIADKENLYRFFLMNEFVDNFETEVEEDYFNVPWSEIAWKLEVTHNTLYERSYVLPYRKAQVKKRFNHVLNDITHREIILQKKKNIQK